MINQMDDLHVCGEADSPAKAMAEIVRLKPDIVLLDITLGNSNGIELLKDIRSRFSGKMLVLVFSMHDEALYAERVVQAGGRGYIMKDEPMKTVVNALRKVLQGGLYLSEQMTSRIVSSLATSGEPGKRTAVESLSDREMEVFELLGDGRMVNEIAEILHISKKTVYCYQQNLRTKLGLKTSAEAIRHAVHWKGTGKAK